MEFSVYRLVIIVMNYSDFCVLTFSKVGHENNPGGLKLPRKGLEFEFALDRVIK